MKKIFLILVAATLFACDESRLNEREIFDKMHSEGMRIIITTAQGDGGSHQIIMVDGCEYLTRMRGGIIHLETCKNHDNE